MIEEKGFSRRSLPVGTEPVLNSMSDAHVCVILASSSLYSRGACIACIALLG